MLAHTAARDAPVADWLQMIRDEYAEIPALILTERQVQRLFCLDRMATKTALDALVNTGVLKRTPCGAYVRADVDFQHQDEGVRRWPN